MEPEIFDRFTPDGVVSASGELYLPNSKALDFVFAREEKELAILGIEAFIRDDCRFIPQFDLIADYSPSRSSRGDWIAHRRRCNTAARQFVEQANSRPNLYFTFVVLAHEEFMTEAG